MLKINKAKTFINIPKIIIRFVPVNLGYIPDLPDNRDYLFSTSKMAVNAPLRDISLKGFFRPISDQLSLGSCVANAVCDALEAQIAQRRKVSPMLVEDLSRLFVYWNSRNLHTPPATKVDHGTYIRFALASVKVHGVPAETIFPYDVSKFTNEPGWLVCKKAIQNKIDKFYRIDATGEDRINQIKQALSNGCPVVFGTALLESFRHVTDDTVIQKPTSTNYIGRHAMVVTGFNNAKNAFEIRNSWGVQFGVNGYCYMSPEYLKADITQDLWVMTM